MKKRGEFFLILAVLLGILFLTLNSVYAQDSYYCAERTINGAWCQNVPLDEVDTSYDYTQTSCEATAFCKTGTCVNAVEGSCRPNVPQRVCEASGGIWDERERDEISQCQLGCCYIGNSASFVTQTKCTSQASRYGVEISFDPGIRDPIQCIASAYPEEEGACVIDDGFVRNCKRLTSAKCDVEKGGASGETTVEFHRGTLCTAAHLETICGPTERTKLEPGRDEVFFEDSCRNTANIYDASKINPVVQDYWDYIIDKEDSCVLSSNNVDSCGNCNYLEGSIGKKYDRGNSQMFPKAPKYGDYICADLGCKSGNFAKAFKNRFERFPEHGESWCGTSVGSEDNLPGSEHFKFICDYGEVNIQQGDPFRQTVCIESEIEIEGQDEGFKIANFRANLWEECVLQDNKEDCEDIQERDCVWIEGIGATLQTLHANEEGDPFVINKDGELVPKEELEYGDPGVVLKAIPAGALDKSGAIGAACVPKYPPALHFWEPNKTREKISSKSAGETCAIGSEVCIVKFEDPKLIGATTCKENCYCLGLEEGDDPKRLGDGTLVNIKLDEENEWLMNNTMICKALGDCGESENYAGKEGHWKLEDLVEVTEIKEE